MDIRTTVMGDPTARISTSQPSVTSDHPTIPRSETLLPLPSVANNGSMLSFALSDTTLPPNVAGADLSIAADGSYVETTSAHAARELKKRYDQLLGIGIDKKLVRSPYIITAIPTQSRQVFRISQRFSDQPEFLQSPHVHSNNIVRRSRLSVGGFLPPSLFKPPGSGKSGTLLSSKPRRTLRKTLSVSDMSSQGACNPALPSGPWDSLSPAVDTLNPFAIPSTLGAPLTRPWHRSPNPAIQVADPGDGYHQPYKSPNTDFPFGPFVTYTAPVSSPETPTNPPTLYLEPSVLNLHSMQSFDSGLMAYQPDLYTSHSHSFFRNPDSILSTETNSTTPYSPAIFEVLQTFHGIPLPDTLSASSAEPTIKLSSTMTATPRDDPRFVIWGQIHADLDKVSLSHSSHASITDRSTQSVIGLGRKKSNKGPVPPDIIRPSESPKKVLMAATIERWIAQLTSELNYDELLHFFLTYRTYINAVDLCRLLICRFHWALERPSSSQDATVRRIVCVRTFLAFRYWLLTFFHVDFLYNRLLCVTLTNWLNTLQKDHALLSNPDAMSIVRKLKKVVRDCKEAHTKGATREPRSAKKPVSGYDDSDVDLFFDERPLSMDQPPLDDFRSSAIMRDHQSSALEINLDFRSPNELVNLTRTEPMSASQVILQQPLHMTILTHTKSSTSSIIPTSIPSQGPLPLQHGALSRALVNTIGRLGRWKRVLNSRSTVPALHCNDVSSFDLELNATGDLLTVRGGVEEYLRMLNLPPMPGPPVLAERTSFVDDAPENDLPLEMTDSSLSGLANQEPSQTTAELPALIESPESEVIYDSGLGEAAPGTDELVLSNMQFIFGDPTRAIPSMAEVPFEFEAVSKGVNVSPLQKITSGYSTPIPHMDETTIEHREPALSDLGIEPNRHTTPLTHPSEALQAVGDAIRTSTNQTELISNAETTSWNDQIASPHVPISSGSSTTPDRDLTYTLEVISLDDYDLSGSGSDSHSGAPRSRKPPRRLPLRRDFQFVRRPESPSSIEMQSSDTHSSTSPSTSDVPTSSTGPGPMFGNGGIKTWQIEMIDSDDDEPGDVEAALRRLEGQIDKDRQRAKEVKVDGWLKQVQERLAAAEDPRDSPVTMKEDGEGGEQLPTPERVSFATGVIDARVSQVSLSSGHAHRLTTPVIPDTLFTPIPEQHGFLHIDTLEDNCSESNDNSNPMYHQTSHHLSHQLPFTSIPAPNYNSQSIHRPLVLMHRSQALAEQFGLIDRELFLAVKFEELVVDWKEPLEEVPVYDWAGYQRDRSKLKAHAGRIDLVGPYSDLYAVRGRYNHMVNFTSSEIVLSPSAERPAVASKLIRVAWKSYLLNNYSTLIAIIQGLQTPAATIAMRRSWSRVGMWEMRLFNDFRAFTNSEGNFRHIRDSIASLTDSRPLHETAATAPSGSVVPIRSRETDAKSLRSRNCIPFIGIYLSQLQRHAQLPDYVDPTSPTSIVSFDPVTGHLNPPVRPDVFSNLSPLPRSLTIEPIINIHKQRLIACVIKSVVAGQHLAMSWGEQFTPDRKLYQKCSRLRCFDPATQMNLIATMPSGD